MLWRCTYIFDLFNDGSWNYITKSLNSLIIIISYSWTNVGLMKFQLMKRMKWTIVIRIVDFSIRNFLNCKNRKNELVEWYSCSYPITSLNLENASICGIYNICILVFSELSQWYHNVEPMMLYAIKPMNFEYKIDKCTVYSMYKKIAPQC